MFVFPSFSIKKEKTFEERKKWKNKLDPQFINDDDNDDDDDDDDDDNGRPILEKKLEQIKSVRKKEVKEREKFIYNNPKKKFLTM